MVSGKQERVTLSDEVVDKLNKFLKNTEHGKKIDLSDLKQNVEFILRDYIKENS